MVTQLLRVSSIIFFRAYAIYIFHKDFFFCRFLEGQVKACRTRQKKEYGLFGEKRDDLSICGSSVMLQTAQYSQLQLIRNLLLFYCI
jgi:hypothetical protein